MKSDLNIKEMIDKLITVALSRTFGNRKAAAKLLGICEREIYRKIVSRRQKVEVDE